MCELGITPMIPHDNGFYLFPPSRAVNSNRLIFDPSEVEIHQYQILINRFGEIKQYTKLSSLYVVCEYEYGQYSDYVSNIYS